MSEFSILEQVVAGLSLLVLGGLLTSIAARYRSRITTLRYYVWHSFFGSSVSDPHFGSVEVMFGGNPVNSLWYSTIQLANDSGRDLADLFLDIACDPDSSLLTSRAIVKGSLNDLPLSAKYVKAATNAQGAPLPFAYKRRDYHVPVLNRGQQVEVYFLTTNSKNTQPVLTVGCDHSGVRLKFAVAKTRLLGEPQDASGILGSAIALMLCWPLVALVPSKAVAVVVGTVLGLLALLLGVGARKLSRLFLRLLG